MKKRIAILGSTGSIGTQALNIIGDYPEKFEIIALSANENIDLLEKQIEQYAPKAAVVTREDKAKELNQRLSSNKIHVETGHEALSQLVSRGDVDIVIMSLVGISGLEPTLAALKAGKTVALANKEVLVAGGHLVNDFLKLYGDKKGSKIIPVDSEHSAIFQAIQGCQDPNEIDKLILTASGGPFRGHKPEMLKNVKAEDALKHPNWKMGKKITIDSSTLMNKGFEVIEAKWLFNMDLDKIEVVVHPESIIHSMVEFVDGSVIAQMGLPDMRLPILYALTYPYRYRTEIERLNLFELGKLTFEKPNLVDFPCLSLAYEAIKIGGSMPVVLNAANEVLVDLFLKGRIAFNSIPLLIEKAMLSHKAIKNPEICDILSIDREIRNLIKFSQD